MVAIVRDTVAAAQLVYAWPFPIGPEPIDVTCGDEEVVVMCPAWVVGDRLGPGRHQWRSPDPAKPTNAYFVLVQPVEVPFDMITMFMLPSTQLPVRLRAQGSLLARCLDPGLLVSQFVGLPFDNINDGILRSVGQSVEKLLARVLVRRVVGAGSALAVTDPSMLPSIVDELTAYNPTAGAVIGVGYVRFNQLVIHADDGGMGGPMWNAQQGWAGSSDPALFAPQQPQQPHYPTGAFQADPSQYGAGMFAHEPSGIGAPQPYPTGGFALGSNPPPAPMPPDPPSPQVAAAANHPPERTSSPAIAVTAADGPVVSGEIGSGSRKKSVAPGEAPMGSPAPSADEPPPPAPEGDLASLVKSAVFPPGTRVLVAAPNGTLHSAVVRLFRQDYYEVEIGASKDVIWVPQTHVIPDR